MKTNLDPSDFPSKLQAAIEFEKKPKNIVIVPKTLTKPHPIVFNWIAEDKRLSSSYGASRFGTASPAVKFRQWRIVSSLLRACETRGFTVKAGEYYSNQLWVSQGKDSIGFILEPWIKRRKRQMTKEEKQKRLYNNNGWVFVEEDTGLLKIRFLSHPRSTLFSLHESEITPMEKLLNDVLITLRTQIWKREQRRLEDEERHRLWLVEEELRRQKEAARKLELQRKALIEQESNNWLTAQRIRSYVAAVKAESSNSDELRDWSVWALAHADTLDPIISGRAGYEHKHSF